jgi:hypothetical protein
MKPIADRARLSLFLALSLLWLFSFSGCSEPKTLPTGRIDKGEVTVSWANFSGAVSYNIYFDGKAGLTKWTSHKIPNASSPITVTDLMLGDTYYFGLAVVGESGEGSILSERAYTVASEKGSIHFEEVVAERPTGKEPTAKEPAPDGHVTLAWDSVPGARSYNLYWSESPGVTRVDGRKITNVSSPYLLQGLKRGKTYYVIVTAVNDLGESQESEELSFSLKE